MGGKSSREPEQERRQAPVFVPPPAPVPLPQNWRPFNFLQSTKEDLMNELKNLEISNPEVECLRILVHGPVGTGKSTFICSLDSIFQGRMTQRVLSDAMGGKSFTTKIHTQRFRDGNTGKFLPFAVSDVMGLEDSEAGAHVEDLKLVLEGHVKEGHKFNPAYPLDKGDLGYNSSPTLNDQVHCLVSMLPADKISFMEDDDDTNTVIKKLRETRKKATNMGIPQVILLTKVDWACPIVGKDLTMVYRSKRIKEKMQLCSIKVGIPLNFIFPVKNYNEEIALDDRVDILLLTAFRSIVNFANDHVDENK